VPSIESYEELERFFSDACKPPDQWRMGMEFEKIGVNPANGRAVPFSGPDGVESLLKRFVERFRWSPLHEGERLLALEKGDSRITLEPGAQLELSGAPHRTLHDLAAEVSSHLEELREATDPGKIAWIGTGCQPVSDWHEIELLPKKRYDIMNRYLPLQGELGTTMMRTTAALQLNLDYESEQDALEKFRLSMGLSPLLTALYANSAVSGGRANGFMSRRAYIWQHTDPRRCGFIEKLYHPEAGFREYVDYALDVPMIFLVRDDRWIEVGGAVSFRQYLESGFQEWKACWDDWVLHLSGIFTEARFKPYLEVRGADCTPPDLVMTFPALLKGILYDRQARQEAWAVVQSWGTIQRQALYLSISRKGPSASVQASPLLDRIREIVRISREGLKRQGICNARGEDETVYLAPLVARLEQGWECPAREILDLWRAEWNGDVRRLIEHCRF
jgi:glutamate--cysteine ligase